MKRLKSFYIDAYCLCCEFRAPGQDFSRGSGAALLSGILYLYVFSMLQIFGAIYKFDFFYDKTELKITGIIFSIFLFNILFVYRRVSAERRQEFTDSNRNNWTLRFFFIFPVGLMFLGWFPKLWLPTSMW